MPDNRGGAFLPRKRKPMVGDTSMSRERVIGVTLVFVAAFGIIANLAWATAAPTTGPWFSPAVSNSVYSTTLLAGTILVVALAALASGHAALGAREIRALELRIGILKGGAPSSGSGIDIDRDIEDTLDEIAAAVPEGGPLTPVISLERDAHDTLVSVTTESKASRQEVLLRELTRARAAVYHAGKRVWSAVVGPIVMGGLFLGIAGVMLPGTEGFAEYHYVLNSTLILFLAYGWPFLVAWTAVSFALARPHNPALSRGA